MALDFHRLAEARMGEGDRAKAAGDGDLALEKYLEAARAEAAAFAATPLDRPRTRGALGISSVALFRRSGDPRQATRQAYVVLAEEGLPDDAGAEIEAILDELRTERLAGMYAKGGGLQWALRGGRVGYGIARSEAVTLKLDQVQRLAWRVFEMLTGRELRTNQPPADDVRRAVDLLVTQPQAGSFTFGIRLADYQLSLEDPVFQSSEITANVLAVLKASQDDEEQVLSDLVPDASYREILQKLVRNLAPDGREIGEIEVREIGSHAPPTILTPETRTRIRRRLPKAPSKGGSEEVELRDRLRVIDLNRRHIALGPVEREQRCLVPEDLALVDLIGGLEDRPVRVKGHWQGKVFVVHDVEPDYGDQT